MDNSKMKIDTISFVVILVMLVSFVVGAFYYNQSIINECTSNPLVFASKKLEKQSGYEFSGIGYFKTEQGTFPTVIFNSSEATLQNPS